MPSRRRVAARALSPDKSRVAVALEVPCAEGICQELRLGASEDASDAVSVAQPTEPARDRVDARRHTRGIPDRRSEWSIYDAQSAKLAGTVRLLTAEAAQTRARPRHHFL